MKKMALGLCAAALMSATPSFAQDSSAIDNAIARMKNNIKLNKIYNDHALQGDDFGELLATDIGLCVSANYKKARTANIITDVATLAIPGLGFANLGKLATGIIITKNILNAAGLGLDAINDRGAKESAGFFSFVHNQLSKITSGDPAVLFARPMINSFVGAKKLMKMNNSLVIGDSIIGAALLIQEGLDDSTQKIRLHTLTTSRENKWNDLEAGVERRSLKAFAQVADRVREVFNDRNVAKGTNKTDAEIYVDVARLLIEDAAVGVDVAKKDSRLCYAKVKNGTEKAATTSSSNSLLLGVDSTKESSAGAGNVKIKALNANEVIKKIGRQLADEALLD